jgi:hypothetical protein
VRSRFFVASLLAVGFALGGAIVPGCNCDKNPTKNPNGDMGVPSVGSITIDPSDVTLDLVQGQPPPTQAFTVTYHPSSGDKDVTGQCTYVLTDLTMGAMNLNVFTAGTDHGGTTQLLASFTDPSGQQQTAIATIHVRVHGTFQGPDCMGGGCGMFPPDNAPQCTATNITPQIYYPNDGVLLPPNMEVVAVHFTPFPAGPPVLPIQEFEIDFENAATDVRVVTKCATQLMDTAPTPAATGGCEYKLDPTVWDFIAKSNRGGDAVKITVRATTDGMCATSSTNSVNIAFGEQDVNGGIYYWKSSITAGGVGGNIWAKAFGNAVPEEQLTGVAGTNLANATCFGCHALSKDGKRMTVNFDDADSDDEYADVTHTLMDAVSKNSLDGHNTYGQFQPGFQAITPDVSTYVATNGLPSGASNTFFMYDAMTGAALAPATATIGPAMVGTAAARPTMPDWAPDGKSILFVQPNHVGSWDSNSRNDDNHVFGGSIYSAPYDPAAKTFGMPTAIVTSMGENNYYPGYSPDGSFIVFNRVPMQTVTNPISGRPDCMGTGAQVLCPNDSFSNPKARVMLLSTKAGAMPVDAENANGSPAASPVDVSNSWPRWSPFIQAYKGDKLLWVTFSSTRDYGLRVRNHKTGMFQCYPSDSLQQAGASHGSAFDANCQQPQIWMAAVNLSHLEFNSTDPSFVAFWLPFQDDLKHNHTAQWTQTVADQPPPDMANCIPSGGTCTAGGTPCCSGGCFGGICGIP